MRWAIKESDFRFELSSDLEWMIQSGQVGTDVILGALIERYYIPVYQLTYGILEDHAATRRTMLEIFQRSVTHTYRYRNQVGVDGWFYRVVWQVLLRVQREETRWRKVETWLRAPGEFTRFRPAARRNQFDEVFLASVDQLSPDLRTLIFCAEIGDVPIEILAHVTEHSPNHIEAEIETIWQNLNQDHSATGLSGSLFHSRGQAAFHTRRPDLETTPELLAEFAQRVNRRISRGINRQRGSATFKEIAFLIVAALLVVALIWGGQQLLGRSHRDASPGASLPMETGFNYPSLPDDHQLMTTHVSTSDVQDFRLSG